MARLTLQIEVTADEQHIIAEAAKAEGVSITNYLRRGVNNMLLESDDNAALLNERNRRHAQSTLTPEQLYKVRRLRGTGWTWRAIGEKLQIRHSVIYNQVKRTHVVGNAR